MPDCSYDEISGLLQQMQDCVKAGRYTIAKNQNRVENCSFCADYRLSSQRQRELLLTIKPEDFCYATKNVKAGYEHEILYIFCLQTDLRTFEGKEESVEIYIKFHIENDDYVMVISFHKRNAPLTYCFR